MPPVFDTVCHHDTGMDSASARCSAASSEESGNHCEPASEKPPPQSGTEPVALRDHLQRGLWPLALGLFSSGSDVGRSRALVASQVKMYFPANPRACPLVRCVVVSSGGFLPSDAVYDLVSGRKESKVIAARQKRPSVNHHWRGMPEQVPPRVVSQC